MSRTDNEGDSTNKTSSNEKVSWEEQDKANQQSICERPIVCSRCQKDGHNCRTCNVISYSRFGQAKVLFSNIFSTLVWFHPLFWHSVHIFGHMSTFWNICPHYVQISEYMSIFQSTYRRFQVNVHIFKNMSTLWNICHFCLITIQCLYFGTNLCLTQITKETL